MDDNEARRKIGALKAIVQTLLLERYWKEDEEEGKREFLRAVDADDPVSMAIATELTEDELDRSFRWPEPSHEDAGEELLATPVVAYLTEGQRERARVSDVAANESDSAVVRALQELDPEGNGAKETGDLVRSAEEQFVESMLKDLVTQQGERHEMDEGRTVDERVGAMPEPWRSRTRKELARLREELGKPAGSNEAT